MAQNCKLTNRYFVLNNLCLFVYKDHLASKSFPTKPMIVIPLNEISSVKKKSIPKKYVALESQMMKSQGDTVYLIEIKLERGKQTLINSINNFLCVAEKSNVKPQTLNPVLAKLEDENTYIFADVSLQAVQRWIRKINKALEQKPQHV